MITQRRHQRRHCLDATAQINDLTSIGPRYTILSSVIDSVDFLFTSTLTVLKTVSYAALQSDERLYFWALNLT